MVTLSLSSLDFRLSDRALVLWFESNEAARAVLFSSGRLLARWAQQFDKAEAHLRYPNPQNRFYKVLASMADEPLTPALMPGVQIASMRLSLPILQVLTEFLESPEERRALVRLHDQRQIALSQSSQVLIKNATVEEAIGRKRESYWYAPDLAEFIQRSQRELEPNNPNSSIVISWRGVDRTGTDWREFTHSYRLIADADGILYHASKNLDLRSIPAPPAIVR